MSVNTYFQREGNDGPALDWDSGSMSSIPRLPIWHCASHVVRPYLIPIHNMGKILPHRNAVKITTLKIQVLRCYGGGGLYKYQWLIHSTSTQHLLCPGVNGHVRCKAEETRTPYLQEKLGNGGAWGTIKHKIIIRLDKTLGGCCSEFRLL